MGVRSGAGGGNGGEEPGGKVVMGRLWGGWKGGWRLACWGGSRVGGEETLTEQRMAVAESRVGSGDGRGGAKGRLVGSKGRSIGIVWLMNTGWVGGWGAGQDVCGGQSLEGRTSSEDVEDKGSRGVPGEGMLLRTAVDGSRW